MRLGGCSPGRQDSHELVIVNHVRDRKSSIQAIAYGSAPQMSSPDEGGTTPSGGLLPCIWRQPAADVASNMINAVCDKVTPMSISARLLYVGTARRVKCSNANDANSYRCFT
jgi:hypothetical protein